VPEPTTSVYFWCSMCGAFQYRQRTWKLRPLDASEEQWLQRQRAVRRLIRGRLEAANQPTTRLSLGFECRLVRESSFLLRRASIFCFLVLAVSLPLRRFALIEAHGLCGSDPGERRESRRTDHEAKF